MTLRMRIEVLGAQSEQSPRSKLLLRWPLPVKLKPLYHPCLVIASFFRRSVLPLLLPPPRAAISTLARLTTSMNATLATRCALPNSYVQDMYEYFRNEELSTSVRSMYMEKQPHINERMRSILVDWLVEVHLKFELIPQTLYLTVNLIDRYLERKEVPRSKLQLVGVTSLFIASKYEEIYPAPLREHVFICDHAYTSNEILGMEHEIPETLKYQVTVPTAHTFLVRFLKQGWSRRQEDCSARMLHFGRHT